MSARNLWDLAADQGALKQAVKAWLQLGQATRAGAQSVVASARTVDEQWVGEAADSYQAHRTRLTDDIEEAAGITDEIAAALQTSSAVLANAQGLLGSGLIRISAKCRVNIDGDSIIFHPEDPADVAVVAREIAVATGIRTGLDGRLLDMKGALSRLLPALGKIAAAWESVAQGVTDPFVLPGEATGSATIVDSVNDRFIINTGSGDDTVEVQVNPLTGERTVVINGVSHPVPAGLAITVRAGEGNDTITVPPGIHVNLVLLGGEGNDTITGGFTSERILGGDGDDSITAGGGDDRVSGGADADYVDGQGGNDTLAGGTGQDFIYGLSGDDRISGGDGRDYLEGASGADTIDGGAGSDAISGGVGSDTIYAGSGNDVVYAGAGTDTVSGGSGMDTVYRQIGDRSEAERVVTVEVSNVGSNIQIEGTPEFVERVRADLDMLRSSPRGQLMLTEMDSVRNETASDLLGSLVGADTVRIVETRGGNAASDGNPDRPHVFTIRYEPDVITSSGNYRPPLAGFFHEMAHVYDYHNGTRVPGQYDNPAEPDQYTDINGNLINVNNRERQAVGLPIDADGDGDFELDPDHPFDYTENGLREELGWEPRDKYAR